jgi:hypothetical protein
MLAPEGYADHDMFVAAVMPYSTMVREVADAGYTQGLDGTWGMRGPGVESSAMAELDQQADFAGAWDTVPIERPSPTSPCCSRLLRTPCGRSQAR